MAVVVFTVGSFQGAGDGAVRGRCATAVRECGSHPRTPGPGQARSCWPGSGERGSGHVPRGEGLRARGECPESVEWVLQDLDPTALALAGVNAAAHGLPRVRLLLGDALAAPLS